MDNTRLQFQQEEDTVINGSDYRLAPPNSGSWILVDEHGVFTPPRNWRHWDQRVLNLDVRTPTSYYTAGQYSTGIPGHVDPARVSYAGRHIAMDRVIIDPKNPTNRNVSIFRSHVPNLFYNDTSFYHSKSIDGGPGSRWWADFNVHGNAKFHNDVTVTNSINITPRDSTYNAIQPTGCDSPLWVRQRGTSFGHSILLDKPEGDYYYGWGVRTNADRHLEFKAYITDDDQSTPELLDSTWNLATHGRAYIARYSDAANLTFTGQHRSRPEAGNAEDFKDKIGLIVVAAGKYMAMSGSNISINDSMPTVELASKAKDKRVFGVISDSEDSDSEEREFSVGAFVTAYDKVDGDDRVIINSVGEGAMWVTNINGNIENGDYITSSEVPGYGMKQDDDLLHNYTVAKITMDCDFDLSSSEYQCEEIEHNGQTYKRAFVGVTYHCG